MASESNAVGIQELIGIVGKDRVSTDRELLLKYGRGGGLVPDGEPVCVVYPRDSEDIQRIVKLANAVGLNLVPRSSSIPGALGGGPSPRAKE